MSCQECGNWKLGVRATYSNGAVIEHLIDRGKCSVLGVNTEPDFSCNRFVEGRQDQIQVVAKEGEPWENWVMGPCPDCCGVGSGNDRACHRCAGTSKVRYYDDGFVGEEQTRLHPMEIRRTREAQKAELMRQVAAIDAGMPSVPEQIIDPTKLAPLPTPDFFNTNSNL